MEKSPTKKLNEDRNRLTRLIGKHSKIIENLEIKISELNSQVSDLESSRIERNKIKEEVETLNASKIELETALSESNSQKENLNVEINSLSNQKTEIETYMSANNPVKETLKSEITSLNEEKQKIIDNTKVLEEEQSSLDDSIKEKTAEKEQLESSIKILRDKHGLYSKDMKDIALDSKKQLNTYAIMAVLSISGALALMILLLCILMKNISFLDAIKSLFPDNPDFQFYTLLIIRLTISAAFIFFFIVFINLTRGFIAQYIKTKNKMTAIRITDFLISRIHTKGNDTMTAEVKLNLENEKLKEQVELLNKHIPKIMDIGSSSFERTSKTNDPTDLIKDILKLRKEIPL